MSDSVEKFFDAERLKHSRLRKLTGVHPSRRFSEVTHQSFPRLFQQEPGSAGQFGMRFTSGLLPVDVAFRSYHQLDDIGVLIYRQLTTNYPSIPLLSRKEVEETTWVPSDWGAFYGYELVNLHSYTPGENHPDQSKKSDKAVNYLLAVRLALGEAYNESHNPIMDVEKLENYAESNAVSVRYNPLLNSLRSIVISSTMDQLLASGIVGQENINDFYAGVADWQKNVAERLQVRRGNKGATGVIYSHLFPYQSFGVTEGQFPEAHFLPFMGDALRDFILTLPDRIEDKSSYNFGNIIEVITKYFSFAGRVLNYQLKRDLEMGVPRLEAVADARATREQIMFLQPQFAELLAFYRKFPGLLNKGRYYGSNSSNVPSERQMREQIEQAGGGRGSRKPWHFRVKHGTPKGDI